MQRSSSSGAVPAGGNGSSLDDSISDALSAQLEEEMIARAVAESLRHEYTGNETSRDNDISTTVVDAALQVERGTEGSTSNLSEEDNTGNETSKKPIT